MVSIAKAQVTGAISVGSVQTRRSVPGLQFLIGLWREEGIRERGQGRERMDTLWEMVFLTHGWSPEQRTTSI